jgi:hypothetical protein
METTSVLDTGFTLDDLRVEELEPRLEFDSGWCNITTGGDCDIYYTEVSRNADFIGYQPQPCG